MFFYLLNKIFTIFKMENYAKKTWYSSQLIEFNGGASVQRGNQTISAKNEEFNMIDFRSDDYKIIVIHYVINIYLYL